MRRFLILFIFSICFLYSNSLKHDKNLVSSKSELEKIAKYDKREFKYKISDFLSNPAQGDLLLSPNGKYISYFQMQKDGKYLAFYNTQTKKHEILLKEGKDLIKGYIWGNNKTIIVIKDNFGDENYQLFALDIKTKKLKKLTVFKDVRVDLLDNLDEDKDNIIVLMNKNNAQIFEPYKLNINNGKYVRLFENKDLKNPITDYYFDKTGQLKAYVKLKNQVENILYYKKSNSTKFEAIQKIDFMNSFNIVEFNYSSKNKDDAYVLIKNKNHDKGTLVLFDLAKNKKIKDIYSNDNFELSGGLGSKKRDYEIDFVTYYSSKFTIVPISDFYKKLHKKFKQKFKDEEYRVVKRSDDETKYLLVITSDRMLGTYYLYDSKKDSFEKLVVLKPYLKKEDMAKMKPIEFLARDNVKIHGYLIMPKGIKKPPLIVNPHGGPYGERDVWHFNSEAQLLASRGYAVLKINYRGSGGYGQKFELAGYKQIGRAMLDDLEDGVKYVKSLNLINENKIAIYGASYGGLASLGSLVKTPNLYQCGVDYVGISNLLTFFNSFPPYWKPLQTQIFKQWYNPNDKNELEIIKKVSPLLNVNKINKNVLVIQGANDPRVNILESDQIVRALRKKGLNVPYLVKYDEGHGFYSLKNNLELYEVMLGFLHNCFNK